MTCTCDAPGRPAADCPRHGDDSGQAFGHGFGTDRESPTMAETWDANPQFQEAAEEWFATHSGDPLTVNELCARSGAWADVHWPSATARWMKLQEEVGEAVKAALVLHDVDARQAVDMLAHDALALELADVALVLASIADHYGVDLTEAIERKARKHGMGRS